VSDDAPVPVEEVDFDDVMLEDAEAEPRTSAAVDESSVPPCSDPPDPYITELLEFPHACAALSDAATWGSASSADTATDVPLTSDELSVFEDSEEEIEFDDDFVVHGGNECGITDPFPDPEAELPPVAEKDIYDADAEEEPAPARRSGRRKSRKKRWYQNLRQLNPQLDAFVAAVSLPEGQTQHYHGTGLRPKEHAEPAEIDGMQPIIKEEGKLMFLQLRLGTV